MNFLKTLGLDGKKNGDNCELFHDAVLTAERYNLSRNDNYDHFTLNIPLRVSIHHCSFTEIQTEIEIEVKVEKWIYSYLLLSKYVANIIFTLIYCRINVV